MPARIDPEAETDPREIAMDAIVQRVLATLNDVAHEHAMPVPMRLALETGFLDTIGEALDHYIRLTTRPTAKPYAAGSDVLDAVVKAHEATKLREQSEAREGAETEATEEAKLDNLWRPE